MTSNIPVTVFHAAVSYAAGKMEQFEHTDPLFIQLVIAERGVEVRVLSRKDERVVHHVVSWHDIEHAQYDALRQGIERAVGQWAGYHQAA